MSSNYPIQGHFNFASPAYANEPYFPGFLETMVGCERMPELNCNDIKIGVATDYHVSIKLLDSKRRPQSLVEPRQVAMYLCRIMTPYSFPEIADSFCKTHATIIHGVKNIRNRISIEHDLASRVERISLAIRGAALTTTN